MVPPFETHSTCEMTLLCGVLFLLNRKDIMSLTGTSLVLTLTYRQFSFSAYYQIIKKNEYSTRGMRYHHEDHHKDRETTNFESSYESIDSVILDRYQASS
jgi:hypothetical protein